MAASTTDFTNVSDVTLALCDQWPVMARALQGLGTLFQAKLATGTEPDDVLHGLLLAIDGQSTTREDWRFKVDSSNDFVIDENTGTDASPTWVTRFTLPAGVGLTADGDGIELAAGVISLELDGSTLSKSASGLKVATSGITNTEIGPTAAIALSKLATLTASRAVVSDGSGYLSASAVEAASLAALDTAQTQVVYVAKTGSDSNAGTKPHLPKLTFGSAMTAASAMTPSSTNVIAVIGLDGAVYNEDISVPAYVNLYAPNVTIGGEITLVGHTTVELYEIDVAAGETAILATTATANRVKVERATATGSGNLFVCVSPAVMLVDCGTAVVEDGTAVGALTTGHMHYRGGDIYITGNGGTALGVALAGEILAEVDHILELSATLSYAIDLSANGFIDLRSSLVDCHVGVFMNSASGTVNVFTHHITGSTNLYQFDAGDTGSTLNLLSSNISGSGSGSGTANVKLLSGLLVAGEASIVNADISSSAAIARSKVAAGTANTLVYNVSGTGLLGDLTAITASRALASDANGLPVASAATATELGYVSGLTSAAQTQISARLPLAGGTMSGAIAMGSNLITNLGNPTAATDAISRQYGMDGNVVSASVNDDSVIVLTNHGSQVMVFVTCTGVNGPSVHGCVYTQSGIGSSTLYGGTGFAHLTASDTAPTGTSGGDGTLNFQSDASGATNRLWFENRTGSTLTIRVHILGPSNSVSVALS